MSSARIISALVPILLLALLLFQFDACTLAQMIDTPSLAVRCGLL
jgi:hypothetical protein